MGVFWEVFIGVMVVGSKNGGLAGRIAVFGTEMGFYLNLRNI